MRKGDMKDAAEELHDGLLKAYSQVRPAKGDKYAYAVALARLALFLRQLRHKDCADWIEGLGKQLHALEMTGHRGPALQSTKNPGKTLSPLERQCRLYVAAGIKALIRSGQPRKEAAKQAKRKVDAIKNEPVNTVLSWMDELGKKNAWVDEHGGKQSNPIFQGTVKLGIDSEHWFQLANGLRK